MRPLNITSVRGGGRDFKKLMIEHEVGGNNSNDIIKLNFSSQEIKFIK